MEYQTTPEVKNRVFEDLIAYAARNESRRKTTDKDISAIHA